MEHPTSKLAIAFYWPPQPAPEKPRAEFVSELALRRQRLKNIRLVPPLPKRILLTDDTVR